MSAQDIGRTIHTNRYGWLYRAVPQVDGQVHANDNKSMERVIKSIIILGAIFLFFVVSKNVDDPEKQRGQIDVKANNNVRYQSQGQEDKLRKDEQQDKNTMKMPNCCQKQNSGKEKQNEKAQLSLMDKAKPNQMNEEQDTRTQVNTQQQANNQEPTAPLVANIHPMALNVKIQSAMPYFTASQSSQKPVYKQLPMCVISMNITSPRLLQDIADSMRGYRKVKHYYSGQYMGHAASINVSVNKSSYCLRLRQMVEQHCGRGQIVVLADIPLREGALKRISHLYQTHNIWLTYQDRNQELVHSLSSFYSQLLLRVSRPYLLQYESSQKSQIRALAKSIAYAIPRQSIYAYTGQHAQSQIEQSLSYFVGRIDPFLQAQATMASISLSDYGFESRYNIYYYESYVQKYTPTQKANKNRLRKQRNNITKPQMQRAIQFMQLKQLASEHVLGELQKQYYNGKYNISQYETKTQLCVVVPSYNNEQNGRYRRVLDSVLQQDYDPAKYHVVFVDDHSNDSTYDLTRKYAEQAREAFGHKISRNLSQVRIDYIRNTQRKYSTNNIYQAVTRYCNQHQVAVLVDGDDQIIGRQVFNLINYAYSTHNQRNWVVYFSHMSSDFGYGTSKHPDPQFIGNQRTPRIPYHAFGALRTFYVKLYLKIKLEDHKDLDGNFWTTIYDDAMQYPLFEMAGPQHIEYIPQIVYFYNRFYGNNDDSSRQKREHRRQQKYQILRRNKYQRVDHLWA